MLPDDPAAQNGIDPSSYNIRGRAPGRPAQKIFRDPARAIRRGHGRRADDSSYS
jgi:hypothetical protein